MRLWRSPCAVVLASNHFLHWSAAACVRWLWSCVCFVVCVYGTKFIYYNNSCICVRVYFARLPHPKDLRMHFWYTYWLLAFSLCVYGGAYVARCSRKRLSALSLGLLSVCVFSLCGGRPTGNCGHSFRCACVYCVNWLARDVCKRN